MRTLVLAIIGVVVSACEGSPADAEKVRMSDLMEDYIENPAKADSKYMKKWIATSSIVDSVSGDSTGGTYLEFRSGRQYVHAYFKSNDDLATYSKGDLAKITCKVSIRKSNTIGLWDCISTK